MLTLTLAACAQHAASQSTASPSASPTTSSLPPLHVVSRGSGNQPVRITEQRGNRKIYELIAKSTESSLQANQFRATFAQTQVVFYAQDGGTLQGSAPTTTIDRAAQTVTMSGGVAAHTSDGVQLTCDQLVYDRKTGLIEGQGNIRVVNGPNTLTGPSFQSDLHLGHFKMNE